MPTPMERLALAYQNIKKITGLKFDENDRDQVANALGKIYIDGHNLWRSKGWKRLNSAREARVFEVSRELERIQNAGNNSFISIMNPDDPYAVPRIVRPATKQKRQAAERYERDFKENHRQNIQRLNQELNGYTGPEQLMDSRKYFREELLNEGGSFKEIQSYVRELSARPTDAVNLCNTVLLGRGYTMEELLRDSEDVREAKKMVGQELEEIMYGAEAPEEKERKFRGMLEESLKGLGQQQMKPIDYSDDSTLDNAKYNQMIATMVTNVYQVIRSAKDTIQSPWLTACEETAVDMKNFTDGIAMFDLKRIDNVNNISDMADAMIHQVLIDRMGTEYDAYRTTPIEKAMNHCTIGYTIHNVLEEPTGVDGLQGASKSYRKAFEEFRKKGNPEAYKKLLNDDVANDESSTEMFREAEENVKMTAEDKSILPSKDPFTESSWLEGIPGMTAENYTDNLHKAFRDGRTSQLQRTTTLGNLFLAYGAYEAEKNGQSISIERLFTDGELQKETGRRAYEFFMNHPIPADTEEATAENVKAFGQVIAALNRKLLDTEVPKVDYRNPEKTSEMAGYLKKFQTLMVDSHQLNALVPQERWSTFLEEQGGADKYQETLNQINIAKVFVLAEQNVQAGRPVEKKNFAGIFERSNELLLNCQATYALKTEGEKYLGKKIGEYPTDIQIAKKLNIIIDTASSRIQKQMEEIAKTKEGQKQLVEYAASFGEKDPAGLEKKIGEEVDSVIEQEKMAAEMLRQAEEAEKAARAQAEQAQAEAKQPEEKQVKVQQPEVKQPEAPAAEAPQAVQSADKEEAPEYDWIADVEAEDREMYKARLQNLYEELDSHDPFFLHSSAEYKAVKAGLKDALKQMDQSEDYAEFNQAMEKVYRNADAYLEKKKNAQIGKHYGQERLNAIRNLKETLCRQGTSITKEKAENIFRIGVDNAKENAAARQLNLENGYIRLGIYMQRAKESGNAEDMQLLDKVIAEKGKKRQSILQLREKLDKLNAELPAEDDAAKREESMNRTRELLCKKISAQKGMTPAMIGWCGVLEGFQAAAAASKTDPVKEIAGNQEIQKILTVGEIGRQAAKIRQNLVNKGGVLLIDPKMAGVITASDTLGNLMQRKEQGDREIFHSLLKDKQNVKAVTDYFERSTTAKMVFRMGNYAPGYKAKAICDSQTIGEMGKKEVVENMIHAVEKQQSPAQKTLQKQKPMKLQ